MVRHEDSSAFALFEWFGEIRTLRRLVLSLGTTKFGPPTCGHRAFVEGIEDTESFDRLLIRLPSATSWVDLFHAA